MVQIFQRESIFCNKISSGGSLFIKKLVPGGTNFGGSIFTMTGTLFLARRIYKRKLFDYVPINQVRCLAAVKRGQPTQVPSMVVSAKATDTFGYSWE